MAEGWPQTSVDRLFQWQYRSIFVGGGLKFADQLLKMIVRAFKTAFLFEKLNYIE